MDFSSFLSDFIKSKQLTSSKIAEQLDVPAATISHLLSGRNKPSLDFVSRLIMVYPTLDLYEILGLQEYDHSNTNDVKKNMDENSEDTTNSTSEEVENKKVKKVVLFYNDNTFEEYNK